KLAVVAAVLQSCDRVVNGSTLGALPVPGGVAAAGGGHVEAEVEQISIREVPGRGRQRIDHRQLPVPLESGLLLHPGGGRPRARGGTRAAGRDAERQRSERDYQGQLPCLAVHASPPLASAPS